MNRKDKIEQEILRTMGILEQKEILPSNPYFYTRVQQRILEKSRKRFSFSGILKPALFTSLVLVNLTTAIWTINSDTFNNDSNTDIELADVLKSDFNLEGRELTENLIFE